LFSRDNKNNLIRIFNEYDEDRIKDFIQKNIKEIEKLTIRNENDIEILTKEITRNLNSKIKRAKKIASSKGMLPEDEIIKNMECALKSAFYMYIRYLYNSIPLDVHKELYCATFYFIREYCYSSMFRYNDKGEFNVPYGGISYNNKDFLNIINLLTSNELIQKLNNNTFISCNDFEVFLEAINLTKNDFIFLDPPYDTEFSTYAKNSFDRKDQIRLAEYLKKTNAKFLLVIKETDFIKSLYSDFTILSFEKQYMVSFKNRNKRDVTHLIIKNY
jgi:DNA adenine methylase